MSRTRTVLIAAGAAAVVGVGASTVPGLAAGGDDAATTAGSTGATTAAPQSGAPATPDGKAQVDARKDEYDAALAKRLGIDVTKLQAAEKAARGDVFVAHLDEMVTNGRISKEDAATLKAAAAAGTLDAALKTLARTQLQARLAEQVKSGRLTQAQADAILKRFDAGDGFGPRGGFGFGGKHEGGHGMFGRHGGMPFGPPQDGGQGQGNGNGSGALQVPQDGPQA